MYYNLEAEMARKGITKSFIAEKMGMRYATLVDKLNGRYPLYFEQAVMIQKLFFPEYNLEYLFSSEDSAAEGEDDFGRKKLESGTSSHQ